MFNYKALSIFLLFADFSYLGLGGLEHDSYKACLGIASMILATAVVCYLISNRLLMLVFSAVLAIVLSQFSMIAREAIKSPEYRQNFNCINTTEELSKDISHGFKRVWKICKNEPNDVLEEDVDEASEEQSGQYRYLALLATYPFAIVTIVKRKPKKQKKEKK